MFDKYKHYIKEPDLVNSNDERIDFLALEKYDFDKEITLLNNIFLKFSDLKEKWESNDVFEKEMDELIFEFHRFFDVAIWWWFSADYLSDDSSIKSPLLLLEYKDNFSIKIKSLIKILEYYIWDLSRTCFYNDFVQEKNSLFFNEETEIILNNFDDIISFFEKLKKVIIDMSFRGFQVWYNEKEEEYRKLLYFREDYFLNKKEREAFIWNSTYLALTLTHTFWVSSIIEFFLNDLRNEWIIDNFINYSEDKNVELTKKNWLYFKKLADFTLNWEKLYLSSVIRENKEYSLKEEIWLFISFKEKTFDILDFFEKLYEYRKDYILDKVSLHVSSIIDLLDVSPFNNRMNNKNITRANLSIQTLKNKSSFFDSKPKKLIQEIKDNQEKWYSISSDEINSQKLKWNNNIIDFIFEEKGTEFNKIELNNLDVIEVVKKDWERKCINLENFLNWEIKCSYGNFWKKVLKYLWEVNFNWEIYHKIVLKVRYWPKSFGETFELYVDSNNEAFVLGDILFYKEIYVKYDKLFKLSLLKNVKKIFTKDTIEDHWEKLEHIPKDFSSSKGVYVIHDKIINWTFNEIFEEQLKIVEEFEKKNNSKNKIIIPDIRTLAYLVYKNLDKINKARKWKTLRLRSSTKVPEFDWVYINCKDPDDDIAGEYYEVVIWEEWSNWKIDISSWSRTELIVDWNHHWSNTSILEIYKKKEGGGIHMILE